MVLVQSCVRHDNLQLHEQSNVCKDVIISLISTFSQLDITISYSLVKQDQAPDNCWAQQKRRRSQAMAWDRVAKWRALDKVLRELMKIHMIQVWNKTKYSETYRNILKHCAVQVQNLKYSETIWNNLKHCNTGMKLSELFWNLLKQSENQTIYRHDTLRTILKLSETRINIMQLDMMQVWNILKYSETWWNSPNHYDNSCDTGMKQEGRTYCKSYWNTLKHSDTFCHILKYCAPDTAESLISSNI